MNDSQPGIDSLESLLDEFTTRCRDGELPSIAEYAARYPQHAEQIEALFPAVAAMEHLRTGEHIQRETLLRQRPMADPPEHLGDFDILRQIGRGGMGVVYEAEQRSLGRRVAVKVLPARALGRGAWLQRFEREAQITARLHHTSIVGVFGVGQQDGLHYYVMPLVRGVGLDEVIRALRARKSPVRAEGLPGDNTICTAGELSALVRELTAKKFSSQAATTPEKQETPESESDSVESATTVARGKPAGYWQTVAQIGIQAAEALGHAHAQQTFHRDIKPGNLLLDENGLLFVADFGLARAVDDSEIGRSGDFAGTARYMAPEQFEGRADVRSDIYALGLTLFELLVLQPAFDARQREPAARSQPRAWEAAALRTVNPAIPRDLEAIVSKCLAYEPAKRYQTAAALAADLRRFLEDRPVAARRASAFERGVRWCRRNPTLAAVSGLAIASLAAFVVTALTGYLETRKAYAEARQALGRSETNAQVALAALSGIYAQLSPERIWIASDADPAGQTCACIGLGAGDASASSVERAALHVRAAPQTALVLENLLVCYDRLGAEAGDNEQVMLQSAIATRRVGDIRLCLGRMEQAEQAYLHASEKLTTLRAKLPQAVDCATELARTYNEIGNICSARRQSQPAYDRHQAAFDVLQSVAKSDRLTAEYQFELARTYYFLADKNNRVEASGNADGSASGGAAVAGNRAASAPRPMSSLYRRSAIRILEELTRDNPRAPDYRLLLALCLRETDAATGWTGSARSSQGRQRAIELLEGLTAEHPEIANYRYELVATYAWIPVSLFPWQGHFAVSADSEKSLQKAIAEAEWLVAHYPTVPHYVRTQALVLAKLAVACWRKQRLAEADDLLRKAVQSQDSLVTKYSAATPHDQALLQFFRLRLAQVGSDRAKLAQDGRERDAAREMLTQCIENLTRLCATPALADDQLAQSSLALAQETLRKAGAKE